jgi:hypothetical protein
MHRQQREQQTDDELELQNSEALAGNIEEHEARALQEVDEELASEHARIKQLSGDQTEDEEEPEPETDPLDAMQTKIAELTGRLEELSKAGSKEEPEPESDDPFHVLKRQFDALQRRADTVAAERDAERKRAFELEDRQVSAQVKELESHKTIIEQAISACDLEVEEAKRLYRDARASGDIDEEILATEALSDAKDKLRQLHAGREAVQKQLDTPPERPKPQPVQSSALEVDPAEKYIVENFSHPKDIAWLRAHKADLFAGNGEKGELARAGHTLATLKHGIKPGTDEYYRFLDEHMGYAEPSTGKAQPKAASAPHDDSASDETSGGTSPAPAVPRKKPPVSAPTSRAPAAPGRGVDRASPEIKALAADLGMTVSEYLANSQKIRDGKWHHGYSNK